VITLHPADDGYRVEVDILANHAAFCAAHPDAPVGARACTCPSGEAAVVARVTYSADELHPAVICHELFHALIAWARRTDISREEDLAYALGRMAGQLTDALRGGP
jgi:hypothetical protein